MSLLSKSCVYGIRASILMAVREHEKVQFISIKDIADELNLSAHFLTKILQQLTQKGLLVSHRGPKGGVKFSRSTSEIKLIEIVEAIDGLALFEECALGLAGCGTAAPCPLHDNWVKHKSELRKLFENESLSKVAENVKEAGLRLRTVNHAELIRMSKQK
jgi:Rrf2 family protein